MFATSEFNPVVISVNDIQFYAQNNDSIKLNNVMIPVYPVMNNSNIEKNIERERVVKIIKAKLYRYLDMSKEITLLLSVNSDYTLFNITSGTYVTFKFSHTKQKSAIITSYDIVINNDVSNTNVYSLYSCTRSSSNNNDMIYNIVQCMLNIQKMETFAERKESFYQLAMEYQIKKMEIDLHMLKHRDNIIKSFNKYNQFDFMFKESYIDKQLTPLLNVLFIKIPSTEQRTSMISINLSTTSINSILHTNDAYQSKLSYMTYHIPSLKSNCTVDEYNVPLYQHTINYGNLCLNQKDVNINHKPIKCECILNELSHGTVVFSFKSFEPIGIICYSDTTNNNTNKYMLSFEHPALLLMLYMFVEDNDDNDNVNDYIININEFIRSRKVIKEKHGDIIENNDYSKSNSKYKNLFVIHKQNRNVNVPSSYNHNNNNKHFNNKDIKTHPLKTFTTYKVIQSHNNNNNTTPSNTLLTTPPKLNQPKLKYIQQLLPITITSPQTYTNIKRYRPNILEPKTLCLNSTSQS